MIRLLFISFALLFGYFVRAQVIINHERSLPSSDSLDKIQFLEFDSIQIDVTQYYHELKHRYDSVEQKYNSITSELQRQVDPRTKLNLPANHLGRKLDSINHVKEGKLSSMKRKFEEVKTTALRKIDGLNLPPELKTKISEYAGTLNKLDLTLPTSSLEIPTLNLADNIDLSIPGIKSQPTEGLPDLSTPNISNVDAVTQTTSQLQELNQVIPEDITSPDQLVEAAESQVTQIKEVDVVQEQLGNVPINNLSEDQAKQQLLNQAKEAAVDHFAGQEQELKEAMALVSKYKRKYGSFNSLEDIMRRKPNEMHGKPLIERIVPGILFQIQKKNDELLVDFNPYAGYRFTGKLTAGLGWNYRVCYNLNDNAFNEDARIYGPRIFTEYKLWKGFSPRVEVETMNTFVPPFARTSPVDLGSRQWVWGVFAGVKKDYKFLKKINGTALVMVRLFDPHHKSPYADVINARFGFEFPMKKKIKGS